MSEIEEFSQNEAFAACPDTGCDWSSFYRGWLAAADKHNRIVEQYKRDAERMRDVRGLVLPPQCTDKSEHVKYRKGWNACLSAVALLNHTPMLAAPSQQQSEVKP